jgi:hypothetical protein
MKKRIEDFLMRLLNIPTVEVNRISNILKVRKLRIQEKQIKELEKESQRLEKRMQAEMRAHQRAG